MKSIKVFYMGRPLREVYPHATKWQVFKWKVQEFLKKCVRVIAWTGLTAGMVYGIFMAGYMSSPEKIQAITQEKMVDSLPQKIESLKVDLVNSIAKLENENNVPIVIDDNKAGSLPKKDKVSIGCMQFKISTVQMYSKQLYGKVLTDNEAVLLALDCEQAKALAKDVIFKVQGGLWNWSVATKEMGAKVEVIKEISK